MIVEVLNIHHYPDIIELAMVAVSRESIEQNHLIRAIDKCVRCFRTDKNIPQNVRNITKMTPEILKNKPNFEKEDALQIKAFLDRQQGPVTLLAILHYFLVWRKILRQKMNLTQREIFNLRKKKKEVIPMSEHEDTIFLCVLIAFL